jgi:hypothetical protein
MSLVEVNQAFKKWRSSSIYQKGWPAGRLAGWSVEDDLKYVFKWKTTSNIYIQGRRPQLLLVCVTSNIFVNGRHLK